MSRENGKIVIRGNEFYEIDLDCERKTKEGKCCSDTSEKPKDKDREDGK